MSSTVSEFVIKSFEPWSSALLDQGSDLRGSKWDSRPGASTKQAESAGFIETFPFLKSRKVSCIFSYYKKQGQRNM